MFNTGRVRRNGMSDGDMEGIPGRLEQAAAAREQYVTTGEVEYIGGLNTQRVEFTQEELEQLPAGLYRDGTEYYGSTHFHPYSQSRYTAMSLMDLMPFDVENHAELIDQPLLMIAGDISDTRYREEASEHCCKYELKVSEVTDDRSHHAGKCMCIGCACKESFIQLVELLLGDLFMVEYLDDSLSVHTLLDETGDIGKVDLLADEVFSTVACHDL